MSEPKKDPKRGTWSFVVGVPTGDGKRRQVHRRGFPTKRAATKAQEKLLAEAAGGTLVDPSTITTGNYLANHWLPSLPGRVRPTTLDAYRRAVNGHLVPRLGTVQLQRLDAATVQTAVARLSGSGLSPKYVRNIHGVLSKALADAVRWRIVGVNVAAGVELPQVGQVAPKAWEATQLTRFLSASVGERLGPLWRFIALTGARRGEALGLRWADVDLDAGSATITRQRVIAGGSVHEGPPKTRSGARTIALDADTVAVLRAWRKRQKEEFFRLAVRPTHDLVFTSEDGGGLWPQRVTAEFKRVTVRLGLPPIGVHGLRHSAASWLIGAGVSPKTVSQRLGHANPSITLAIYSHVLPGYDQAAAEALAEALRPVEGDGAGPVTGTPG